jgi:putative SOS response-associated peptidase YedK
MCGRFGLIHSLDEILRVYSLNMGAVNFQPRFNIAPGQYILTITSQENRNESKNIASSFKWGFVPSWAKDISVGSKMINARAETVYKKPSFSSAFQGRRCLIPASGFYEWQTQPTGSKQPFWISAADGGLLTFAGLWESWMSNDGNQLQTCTIITTNANSSLEAIHNRMPVIIEPDKFNTWLKGDYNSTQPSPITTDLLRSSPDEITLAWPVSRRVNNISNGGASLIEPADASLENNEKYKTIGDKQGKLFPNED